MKMSYIIAVPSASWDKKGVRSRKETILVREHWCGFNCDTIMGKAAT